MPKRKRRTFTLKQRNFILWLCSLDREVDMPMHEVLQQFGITFPQLEQAMRFYNMTNNKTLSA